MLPLNHLNRMVCYRCMTLSFSLDFYRWWKEKSSDATTFSALFSAFPGYAVMTTAMKFTTLPHLLKAHTLMLCPYLSTNVSVGIGKSSRRSTRDSVRRSKRTPGGAGGARAAGGEGRSRSSRRKTVNFNIFS